MDLACSVVVLLMSCVFGSPVPSLDVNREGVQPVDDRPIPIDSNSTGLYEDRYDENTTLWNRNSTGMSEDQYVDKSPLLDSISTGPYEDRYDENSTLADRNKTRLAKENNDEINVQAWNTSRDDDILLANRNNTGPYEDRYDENSTLADRNKTRLAEGKYAGRELSTSGSRDAPPLITRQETLPSCLLSTCIVHHLSNLLQTGDETAGDKTKDIHGPG